MRRKALVVVLIVSVLFSGGAAFTFKNEPEGFRGLKWGDPPGEKMEFVKKRDKWTRIYRNSGNELKLGDARFYVIEYEFYTPSNATIRRLMGVSLYFDDKENFDILEIICKVKFGKPTQEGFYELVWASLSSTVALTYYRIHKGGFLLLGSTTIFEQYTQEKEEKQAEEAEKDW
ncbi:hypothetical protein ES702_02032 [subsurface metagenome]